MGKSCVAVGYSITHELEDEPGVWVDEIIEHIYYGDVIKNTRRLENSNDGRNDNINVSNTISIIADPFAQQNFYSIRYCKFMGVKWKVTNVDVEYPRLLLTLGGVYNAEQA